MVLGQTRTANQHGPIVLKGGKYYNKSISYSIKGALEIPPQLQIDSLHCAIGLLEITGQRLTLLNSTEPSSKEDVAGVLTKNSLIEICNIDHRVVYGDMGTPSHEIWYTIEINGRQYYVDVMPASMVDKQLYHPKNQLFTLFAKYTPYERTYTNSYPESFRVLVFESLSSGWKLGYDSKELNFENGNEFWAADNEGDLIVDVTDTGLGFQLVGFKQRYSATWNGRNLVNTKVESIE